MIITWWGVRGSRPTPGPTTVRYGGNTACVAIQRGPSLLIIDAGTGIVPLGDRLPEGVDEVLILLTHRHMDHLQGLSFFEPLYGGNAQVGLLDLPTHEGYWTPLELFDGISVPMAPPAAGGRVARIEGDPLEALGARGWHVARLDLRHPGGCVGYRITEGGSAFVHLTDSELGNADAAYFGRCAEFCRGATVLSHDAQYLHAEMGVRRGRGHSSVERACDLAREAGVGTLVLFHHDPARDDDALDAVGRLAEARLRGSGVACVVGREGLTLEI